MKKTYSKYIALTLLAASLGLSSCDSFLDELPDNRMELNGAKDITDLLLCQTFCVENSCQTVTFLLLVTQDGEDLRMEVAITVTGDTELQFTAMAIG